MAFSYDSDFLFIGKGDESFLENYSYELSSDPDSLAGKVFMALEILNNLAEAEDIGEAIFGAFKEKFYENVNADPYKRFEASLKAVNVAIENMKEQKVSRFIGNMNISIGAIVGENLFISSTGDAEVYLVRKKFVSVISEGLAEDSKGETFINVANGTLEPFDRVLFTSSRLLRYITKSEFGRIFGNVGRIRIGNELAELQDFVKTEILGRSSVIGVYVDVILNGEDEEGEDVFEPEERGPGLVSYFKKMIPSVPDLSFLKKIDLSGLAKLNLGSVKNIFKKAADVAEAVKEAMPSKTEPLPKIKLPSSMSKGRILILLVVLSLALVIGIFWLKNYGDQRRIIAEQQARLNHVRELINDAVTSGQFDKQKASELLVAGEKETVEVLNSSFLRGEAVKMLDDIQKQRDMLDDVKRVTDPILLADFSEKKAGVSALGLLALKDRFFGFERNSLFEIVLDKLQDPLTISGFESIILGAGYPEGNSLLFLTMTGKMIEYSDGRFANVTTKDGIWKKGVDMKTYNDKAYILDAARNQIWRYKRLREGFDAGDQYSVDADLSKGVSIAIDSSVYVLNSDATVIQLYQGKKQEYPLRRAPLSVMVNPTKIFTSADLPHVYILEPSKNRVLVFRKDPKNGGAQYQTQYVFEKTGALRDLAVQDSRLYVMDDKKVYFVNLSGL